MRYDSGCDLPSIESKPQSLDHVIKIPIKIVSEANSTEHWTKKSSRHKTQKMIVRAYLKWRPTVFPVYVTLIRYAPRPYDDDNLQSAFKYMRDQISETLLDCHVAGRADNDGRIKWIYNQKKTKCKEHYVEIHLSEQSFFVSEEF